MNGTETAFEFTPEVISVIFLCVGIALACVTLIASKGTRREKLAGWVAALLVCVVDYVIESYAARMNWWRLHGAGPVIGMPLIYPAGWFFFTFHFFLMFAAARRILRQPAIVISIFFCAGVSAGMLWNFFGSRYLGTLTFSGAQLPDVIWVWGFLVALGLVFYHKMTARE